MAITNSAYQTFEAQGISNLTSSTGLISSFQTVGVALSGASQQTSTLSFATNAPNTTFSKGKARIKVYAPGGNGTTCVVYFSGTDGTNTEILFAAPAVGFTTIGVAGTTGSICEYLFEFISEFNLNSFSVYTTLAGTTTATLDWEVFGTP